MASAAQRGISSLRGSKLTQLCKLINRVQVNKRGSAKQMRELLGWILSQMTGLSRTQHRTFYVTSRRPEGQRLIQRPGDNGIPCGAIASTRARRSHPLRRPLANRMGAVKQHRKPGIALAELGLGQLLAVQSHGLKSAIRP